MATYKTKDGVDRVLPGIGVTVNGVITTAAKIENPMFELVPEDGAVAPAQAPQQPVQGVAPAAPVAPVAPAPQTEIKEQA